MKKSVLLVIAFLCLSPLSFGQGGTGGGGGGGDLAPTTVAKLPVSPTVGTVYSVKDGNSVTDCSVGGGTTGVVCLWTGSVWTAIGSAAGTGANTALSNLVSPTPNASLVLAPGLSIGSSDTGTPKFTFGTNSITPSQPVLNPAGSTAPTLGATDATTKLANAAFVQNAINRSMSTMPLANITGGTYSFASLGSGAVLVLNASGGVVTSLNVVGVAGSGYAVGDLITPQEGNYDAVLQVATLSGSGVATINVLYGGTGYPGPVTGNLVAVTASTFPFTLTLAGTLTTNATVIMPNGTYLAASNQWIVNNNTTGAHTVTFFVSNGSDATTGSGVVIPQGSNNSTAAFIQTDGATDIWLAAASVGIVNGVVPTGASLAPTGTGAISANQYKGAALNRSFGFSYGTPGGTPISTGVMGYVVVPTACTIKGWSILVDAGTATVTVWKVAAGTAIPTVANTISTSGLAISTGTVIQSTTLTDFTTTAVAAGDIIAANISAASGVGFINFQLTCDY